MTQNKLRATGVAWEPHYRNVHYLLSEEIVGGGCGLLDWLMTEEAQLEVAKELYNR